MAHSFWSFTLRTILHFICICAASPLPAEMETGTTETILGVASPQHGLPTMAVSPKAEELSDDEANNSSMQLVAWHALTLLCVCLAFVPDYYCQWGIYFMVRHQPVTFFIVIISWLVQVDDLLLQTRHATLEFVKTHRLKKGSRDIIQSLMAEISPSQGPEFLQWLSENLKDHKTNYTHADNADKWASLRSHDSASLEDLIHIFGNVFSMAHARREVTLVSLDQLFPKLLLAGKWQGTAASI